MGSEDEPTPPSGPRPEPFDWPFDLAHRAVAAIENEIEELQSCSGVHEQLAGELLLSWVGHSCSAFTGGMKDGLAKLSVRRRQLAEDVEELQQAIRQAEEARERRQGDITAWNRQQGEYLRSLGGPGGAIPR